MMRCSTLCLTLMLGGLVAGCAGDAAGVARRNARAAAPVRPTLEAVAERLPAAIANFSRGDVLWHERERPGYGVAVDYAGPGRSAVSTVSIYDRGSPLVPEAIASPAMRAEFDTAIAEVMASAGNRTSQQIVEQDRSELAVPGQAPLQCANLQGNYGRQPVLTLLCLGGAAGRFIKVVVTSPARQVRGGVDPTPFVVSITQAARG